MKFVVQRVKHTTLTVDNKLISEIPHGLVCFVGFTQNDENVDMVVSWIKENVLLEGM